VDSEIHVQARLSPHHGYGVGLSALFGSEASSCTLTVTYAACTSIPSLIVSALASINRPSNFVTLVVDVLFIRRTSWHFLVHLSASWHLYLLTPFMLALFMVPGMAGIAVRFFQQVLAILAWPVGFALTNLVALAVWTDFRAAVGANPASVSDAVYSPLLTFMGGILATIMIIVGMLATPVVMQALFAQGQAFTGQSGNFAHMLNMGSRSIYGLSYKFERGRGTVAPPPLTAPPSTPPPSCTRAARNLRKHQHG
jgi:hypothetical protein